MCAGIVDLPGEQFSSFPTLRGLGGGDAPAPGSGQPVHAPPPALPPSCTVTGVPVATCAAADGSPSDADRPDRSTQSRWGQRGTGALRGRSRRRGRLPVATPPCHPERSPRRGRSRRISCLPDRLPRAPEILRLRGCAPALRMTGESWLQESDAGGRRSGRCDRMSGLLPGRWATASHRRRTDERRHAMGMAPASWGTRVS